jgi:hypothetical protein
MMTWTSARRRPEARRNARLQERTWEMSTNNLTRPEGLSNLLDAYDTVLADGPSDDERRAAPLLDDWIVEMGLFWPVLHGLPTGHPSLRGPMYTSSLLYVDADRGVARCVSRWYQLGSSGRGAPAPDVVDAGTQFEKAVIQAWREQEDVAVQIERSVKAAIRANPERLLMLLRGQIENSVADRLRTLVERWPDRPRCVLRSGDAGTP